MMFHRTAHQKQEHDQSTKQAIGIAILALQGWNGEPQALVDRIRERTVGDDALFLKTIAFITASLPRKAPA